MGRQRDWRELADLATNPDIDPFFQQRAAQVLLAPHLGRLPFSVSIETQGGTYAGLSNKWISRTSEDQAQFVAGLLPGYIAEARGDVEAADRARTSAHGADQALFAYNNLILQLLPSLPPEQAEALFEHFDINDPLAYANMDTASGYNPLESLLRSKLDEEWKRKGIARMHQRIEAEDEGIAQAIHCK